MSLSVVIAGRANVGKSTLFNRLVGKKLALVDDQPGVTRDRREGDAKLGDLIFRIIDTAGLENASANSLEARMSAQSERAIAKADIILFLVDGRAGITPLDKFFAEKLRPNQDKLVLVVNKAEGKIGQQAYYEAFELGFDKPVMISAEHGEGMADLYQAIKSYAVSAINQPTEYDEYAESNEESIAQYPLHIAIVGRPNSGKSTLVNSLINEERLLTGSEAGITRDSISIDWQWQGRKIKLYDTAGIRRKARVNERLEKLSVADSLHAIKFAEVVILLMEPDKAFETQDLQLASLVEREGRALIIAVNKWDKVDEKNRVRAKFQEQLERLLPQLRGSQLVTISGLYNRGFDKLLNSATSVHKLWNRRISTAKLNQWLEEVVIRHPPPTVSGRRIKLRYITQIKSRPPHFALFCSRPESLPESYQRYLVNSLREHFSLNAIPIRLRLRKPDNPYAKKK